MVAQRRVTLHNNAQSSVIANKGGVRTVRARDETSLGEPRTIIGSSIDMDMKN